MSRPLRLYIGTLMILVGAWVVVSIAFDLFLGQPIDIVPERWTALLVPGGVLVGATIRLFIDLVRSKEVKFNG